MMYTVIDCLGHELKEENYNQAVRLRLAVLMSKYGLRQTDLVRNTGVSQALVSQYCRFGRKPAIETRQKIASALHVTPDVIWGKY